jgi:hypothetical protein
MQCINALLTADEGEKFDEDAARAVFRAVFLNSVPKRPWATTAENGQAIWDA